MTEYTNIKNTALRLITKKGAPLKIKRYADPAPVDANKPWRVGTGTITTYDHFGVILDFRPDQVEGYAFQRGDRICYIPAEGLSIIIQPTDIIEWFGEDWAIIEPARVYPSNEDILFQNYVRKWPRRLS